QVEETGYDALRNYLDRAAEKLKDDPDKAEIMSDFEQAVADKCDARLSPRKNVVTAAEIDEVIKAMGPVDTGTHDEGAAAPKNDAAPGAPAPKRLYRIYEGSMFRGVCAGIAAYFNTDATLVRALFVILTILTGGGWIIAYLIMMFVMPVARTADDVARAHGEPPFTAQDFIDRAKTEYAKVAGDPDLSKAEWKQKARAWRQEARAKRRAWRDEWRTEQRERHFHEWHDGHHHSVAGMVVGGIIYAILAVAFVLAVISFLMHGVVFGYALGAGHPIWVTLLFLFLVFWIVSLPFKAMSRHCHSHPYHHHGGGVWSLLSLVLLFYVASLLFPPVHTAWETVVTYLQRVR
ncbi:MAG: PspC domain-containing protein, partial [Candidatus Pacebacteria bacterium]|nr:PspC domain-containing protein [Candidatus Paceibacterota bacterium]